MSRLNHSIKNSSIFKMTKYLKTTEIYNYNLGKGKIEFGLQFD